MEHSRPVRLPNTTDVDAVCWDWNGTLLDDTAVALGAMNSVLHEQGLPVLPDVEAYRRVFGFPVQAFYVRLGISDVDFRVAAGLYLELFASRVGQAQLHAGADAALSAIRRLGVEQVLISATVANVLDAQMAPTPSRVTSTKSSASPTRSRRPRPTSSRAGSGPRVTTHGAC